MSDPVENQTSMFHPKASFTCDVCQKETAWNIEHRLLKSHSPVVHCFVCSECGRVVPDFSLSGYLQTGKVVIPI